MARPFLSLLIAVAASTAGLALTSTGAVGYYVSSAAYEAEPDVGSAVATFAGVACLGLAAASLAVHWVGALVVGSVHALLGLLALVVPFGNPFGGGIFSPVFQITRMLATVDRTLSEGATVFYFSGTALVMGAFLVAAALGIRSRRLSGWSSRKAVLVSSALGGAVLLAAVVLLVVVGGQFATSIFQMMKYDAGLAALTVVAGVLAGLAGLLLRWSSLGTFVLGGVVLLAGAVAFLMPMPPQFPGRLVTGYGLVMIAGVTFVGAALG
ncbi:MAG TPA: hypothetical protein VGF99_20960, partial [Myxococcota bacterium]